MPVRKHSQHTKMFKNKGKDETVSTPLPVPAFWTPLLAGAHGGASQGPWPPIYLCEGMGNGSGCLQLRCLGGFWDVVWGWLGCNECGGTGKGDVSLGVWLGKRDGSAPGS